MAIAAVASLSMIALPLAACGSDAIGSASDETFTGVMTVRPRVGQQVSDGDRCTEAVERRLIFVPEDHGAVDAELVAGTWSPDPDLPDVHVCALRYTVRMAVADSYEIGVDDSPKGRVSYEDLSQPGYQFYDPSLFYESGSYE